MILLQNEKNELITDCAPIPALETADSARILAISDSHGNPVLVQAILERIGEEHDALCFCGDGFSDLSDIIESAFHDKRFRKKLPPTVFFVRGNGDNSTALIFTDRRTQITIPETDEFIIAGKKFFMTHGHRYNVYYGLKTLLDTALEKNADIVLYGHTHIPNVQIKTAVQNGEKRRITILNPGSCSQPRGGMPNTFASITVRKNSDKIECFYYKMSFDPDGEIFFDTMKNPSGELKFF